MKHFGVYLLGLCVLAGCTIPLARIVTNVSEGPGEIVVEKCSLEQNIWTTRFEQRDCQTIRHPVAAPR